MLPEGWQRKRLHEIADLDQRSLSSNTPSDFRFRYISLSDVIDGMLSPNLQSFEFGSAPSRARRLVQEGDILFSTVRPNLLGHLRITEDHADCVTSTGFSVLTAKDGNSPQFLYQCLFSESFKKQIDALVVGSSFPAVGHTEVSNLLINLPEKREQCLIGQVLATWDRTISHTQRLLEVSRKQLLVLLATTLHAAPAMGIANSSSDNGGFPVSVQPGIPTLPPTPAGWRRVQIRQHLQEVRRNVRLVPDESYTLVTVKRSRGGVQQREILRGSEIKTPTQSLVKEGDFLISKRQIVHGACGIVPPELDGALVSNEYAVINTDGQIDLKFLRYLSESRYFQQTCFHSSIGVHVEKMIFKTERWLSWPFNIPPLKQQARIVEILNAASREVELIERQLVKLRAEKTALMAQLLSGKRRVRLPVNEAVATP